MQMHEVIRKPLITEKNAALQVQGKYAFEVNKRANKNQVKEAVEAGFNVTVTAVNMISMRGKSKRMGRRIVQTPDWKKAVVTLKAGDKIELFESV